MNIEEVKSIMINIEDLSGGQVKCYLAGGYLRDMTAGLTPKDIDIMVTPNARANFDADDMADVLSDSDFSEEKAITQGCDYMADMSDRGVKGLFIGSWLGNDVQFILYQKNLSQDQVSLDMDIGICQISMNSDGDIVESENFVNDFADGVVRVYHDYDIGRRIDRVNRMLVKFPTFKEAF